MAGVLLIVTIPKKEYELLLRKTEKKEETQCDIIDDLKRSDDFDKQVKEENRDVKFQSESNSVGSGTNSLYNSDNTLVDNEVSFNNDLVHKSSWSEVLKQILRPNRSKLKITNPCRGADILAAFHSDTLMETIISEVLSHLAITNATWTSTNNNEFWQIIFALESGNLCEETLQVLRTLGVGSRYSSSVSVVPCTLFFKPTAWDRSKDKLGFLDSNPTAWSRFTSSVCARTNLAQVLHAVKNDAALTFDWLFLLIVAAFVAAIGLVENSTVILVASMLISPLMGPITAGTLGTAMHDRSLQRLGVQNELLGLFLSLVIGFIFGLAICAVDERYGIGDWPTYEMMSRCEIRSLWIGVLVAIPSGAGVALAVLGEYTASFVGVAISASLLPPAVNAGLLWAMAVVHMVFLEDETRWSDVITSHIYSQNPAIELAILGTVSLCLTLVNIVCIFLVGVAVYKVKEVSPMDTKAISWWRKNKNPKGHSKRRTTPSLQNDLRWNEYTREWEKSEHTKAEDEGNRNMIQDDNIKHSCKPIPPPKPQSKPAENSSGIVTSENNCSLNSKLLEEKINAFNDFGAENFSSNTDPNRMSLNINMPTIEPPLCYTVGAKKPNLVLTDKSFDV